MAGKMYIAKNGEWVPLGFTQQDKLVVWHDLSTSLVQPFTWIIPESDEVFRIILDDDSESVPAAISPQSLSRVLGIDSADSCATKT